MQMATARVVAPDETIEQPKKRRRRYPDPALEEIERELVALVAEETQRWQRMAALLIRVEKESLWRGRARSFTQWVNTVARQARVHPSNLWRCLKAGRFYLGVCEDRLQQGQPLPSLEELPSKTSAESFELCEKISRAAPSEVVDSLIHRTFAGDITRRELRELWQLYRPTHKGETGRGRGTEPPQADFFDPATLDLVGTAEIVTRLRYCRGSWLDHKVEKYQVFTDVRVRTENGAVSFRWDVVAAAVLSRSPRVVLCGILLAPQGLEGAVKMASRGAPFVDQTWVATSVELAEEARERLPEDIGVLAVGQRIVALRAARDAYTLSAAEVDTLLAPGALTGLVANALLARLIA